MAKANQAQLRRLINRAKTKCDGLQSDLENKEIILEQAEDALTQNPQDQQTQQDRDTAQTEFDTAQTEFDTAQEELDALNGQKKSRLLVFFSQHWGKIAAVVAVATLVTFWWLGNCDFHVVVSRLVQAEEDNSHNTARIADSMEKNLPGIKSSLEGTQQQVAGLSNVVSGMANNIATNHQDFVELSGGVESLRQGQNTAIKLAERSVYTARMAPLSGARLAFAQLDLAMREKAARVNEMDEIVTKLQNADGDDLRNLSARLAELSGQGSVEEDLLLSRRYISAKSSVDPGFAGVIEGLSTQELRDWLRTARPPKKVSSVQKSVSPPVSVTEPVQGSVTWSTTSSPAEPKARIRIVPIDPSSSGRTQIQPVLQDQSYMRTLTRCEYARRAGPAGKIYRYCYEIEQRSTSGETRDIRVYLDDSGNNPVYLVEIPNGVPLEVRTLDPSMAEAINYYNYQHGGQ